MRQTDSKEWSSDTCRHAESTARRTIRTHSQVSRRQILRRTAQLSAGSVVGSSLLTGAPVVSAQTETGTGGERSQAGTAFRVRIENVSSEMTLQPAEGQPQPVPLSPGAYAVFMRSNPIFTPGKQDRGQGVEGIAEDGDPTQLGESLPNQDGVTTSGVFDTPVDGNEPSPIGPGQSYQFMTQAMPGERLTFATMFVPSNDLFFSPDESGIALFDGTGHPIQGNVTPQVLLWDAGTEQNQAPGVGPDQVERQSSPNTGPEETQPVRLVSAANDGYQYPAVSQVINVTVVPQVAMNQDGQGNETGMGNQSGMETETPGGGGSN
ncbi:spondin domain-containing protein [Haladaptatus caseinilyticus]|uniref:spondin domain-containing protein n=1 Tax=Haladaptatus caseinilyticus TaxID=2993314 RepID=UPI00224B318A|nr:spondin domain-containing protein [Haladaptatus caseinilyticus]